MISVNEKLIAFRAIMEKENIAAYYIPTNDYHGSEYVSDHFKSREFMSGFTGSAGTLIITKDFAGLWTDGRYFIQAAEQIKGTEISLMKMGEPKVPTIEEFLLDKLANGDTFGFDGRCVSADFSEKLKESFAKAGKEIAFNSQIDLVDEVWTNRPAISFKPVWKLSVERAGIEAKNKLDAIRIEMEKSKATAHLLTSLEDIAWTLNLRGNDIHCDPVFLSYLYITKEECILFADKTAFAQFDQLGLDGVQLKSYEEVYDFVKEIRDQKILLDKRIVNASLVDLLSGRGNSFIEMPNPSTKMKAIKCETELRNIREAHILDGIAVTKFLFFLKNYREAVKEGLWTEPLLTEMKLAEILLQYRKECSNFMEESFDPIMAYGKNGAIVHYSASEETDTEIGTDNFLLSDTGAHYLCGTTDITRTISMARADELSKEQKKHYTLVLKAHLRLLDAKFPKGVTGNSLDAIAREPLWQEGLDFNHGTGHGVGYILSVHEGPNAFRTYRGRGVADLTSIVPGMVTSDEPGLYFEGKYGIRLESLIECVEEANGFYGFRALTFVPFDRDAIDENLLNFKEKSILNTYHKQVYDRIGMSLKKEERDWLYEVTKPIQ